MKLKIPVMFDPAIVEELAERLVAHHLHAYREGIANAYDADSAKIVIENSPETISFEDWGLGVQDVSTFCKIGAPTKRAIKETSVYKRKPIGSKGLGFLSYFKLGKTVTLSSNNGIVGYRIIRGSDEPLMADAEQDSCSSFLDHKGLKVEITKLTRMIDNKELKDYLKKYFSLIMSRGFLIVINGKSLTPKKLVPTTCIDTKFGQIVGDFVHHATGSADVFCRGVFVRRVLIDASRDFQAWVDCDFLVPESGREDFVKDNDEWKLFFKVMKNYVQRFSQNKETVAPRFEQSITKLLKALGHVVTGLGLRVEGEIPQSPKPNETSIIKGEAGQTHEQRAEPESHKAIQTKVPSYDKMHTFLPTEKIMKVLKTDYGIKLEYGHSEGDLNPIVPEPPNTLIYNQSSEILKGIASLSMSKGEVRSHHYQFSPIHYFIPYFARAYVHLLPTQKTENLEELTDKIANALYKKMRQMSGHQTSTENKEDD